jgi:hypothetical protein
LRNQTLLVASQEVKSVESSSELSRNLVALALTTVPCEAENENREVLKKCFDVGACHGIIAKIICKVYFFVIASANCYSILLQYIEEEFAELDLHSVRLEERFVRTMETLIRQPDKSIGEASENRAEAKAIYRVPGNESFDREEILRAHREATIRRMAEYGGTILAVQDTTGVNYNTHLKTEGIGYISDKTLGVNVHSCLAVT